MQYSKQGLELTESFEAAGGPRLVAYRPLPTDRWTLGYGHTQNVKEGDTCSPEQAVQWILDDTLDAQNAVNRLVNIGLTQEEFDALVDLVFNIGATAFANSTMLKMLNCGDIQGAIDEFDKWDVSGGQVVAGLLRRRDAEKALFTLGADFSTPTVDAEAAPGEAQPQPEAAQ